MIVKLARREAGGIGPIGQVFVGLAGLIFSLGLVLGISTIGGVIRDQAGYASVMNAAASTAARDVNVQALAGGAALVDPTNAQTTFNDYLSLPTEGDLTNNGGGSYTPAGGEGSVNAPTVTKVKLGTFTASGATVAISGTATDVIPMPIIGTITESLPENTTITATPSLANIAP